MAFRRARQSLREKDEESAPPEVIHTHAASRPTWRTPMPTTVMTSRPASVEIAPLPRWSRDLLIMLTVLAISLVLVVAASIAFPIDPNAMVPDSPVTLVP